MAKYITINNTNTSEVKSWSFFPAKPFTDAHITLSEITFLMGCKTQLRGLYSVCFQCLQNL